VYAGRAVRETLFVSLAADLSTRFTGLEAERVDEEIRHGLRALVEFLGTDRSTLFEFARDEQTLSPIHSWARPGFEPIPAEFALGRFPWFHSRLVAGEIIRIERLPDDLPRDAVAELEYAGQTGFKSTLAIPIAVGGRYVCALTTGTFRSPCTWAEPVVEQVRLVGQILANALYRQRAELSLRASLDEVRRLKDRLETENVYLREETESDHGFDEIVGRSRVMRDVLARAAQVAPTGSTVLLLGETGSGKDLLARFVHSRSPRRDRILVKVNCAALPPTLVESELFGHERGAFTGASATRIGRFEVADGGTLFLDEVGELPIEVQAKLLRVLQDGEFERVGASRGRKVDVRVVAATNRDLERSIAAGRFREDLYYRLSVFPLRLPPLRERREDIPLLVWAIVARRQADMGRHIETIPRRVMEALMAYAWPGNVRELENVIERGLILSPGSTLHLDEAQSRAPGRAAAPPDTERMDRVERAHILAVLGRSAWIIDGPGHAAETLGLHPNTLRSRMKKLGIRRPTRSA
jgi:formate hydrogenlyase transcriptional activator